MIDHGCGIEIARMSTLFETFSLITDEPSSETHGIGIGLSTAKMLCEALGG